MASPQLENGYIRIANEITKQLVNTALLGAEFQILLFILSKTYGYNKKKDWISLTQYELGTGLSRPTVVKALKNLVLKNIIRKSESCVVSFNKDYETWVVKPPLLVKHSDTASKDRLTNIGKAVLTHKRHKTITKDITETKVSKKQSMKNSFKYNENKHTDEFEDVIDYDTGEAPKRVIKTQAPFSLERELEKMESVENSHSDIIATFIRAKKLKVENKGQLSGIQYRHTADAKRLSGAYTNTEIMKAIAEIKKEMPDVDWTIGTVLKVLTK